MKKMKTNSLQIKELQSNIKSYPCSLGFFLKKPFNKYERERILIQWYDQIEKEKGNKLLFEWSKDINQMSVMITELSQTLKTPNNRKVKNIHPPFETIKYKKETASLVNKQ